MNYMNYMKFLEENLNDYLNSFKEVKAGDYNGLISAHEDKCSQYVGIGEEYNIKEEHIRLMHLQTYVYPFSIEVRNTSNGWVSVDSWLINNYDRFKENLERLENDKVS